MSALLYFVLFLLALVIVALLYVLSAALPPYLIYRHFRKQGVRCAPFIPFVGHLRTLAAYRKADRSIYFLEDTMKEYGPVHVMNLGATTAIRLNDPRLIADVLRTKQQCYRKPRFSRLTLGNILGLNSLLLTEGEQHARHRALINPAFHWEALKSMVELMALETSRGLDDWLNKIPTPSTPSSHVVLDLHRQVSALTLSIISKCAFGEAFASLPQSSLILYNALERSLEIMMKRVITMVQFIPIVRRLPIVGRKEQLKARKEMFELVDRVVRDRREGKTGSAQEGTQDLLGLLLTAKDPQTGATLTDVEVRDEAMTFVLAGHETTSNLMCWTLYVLMSRPELWQLALDEVLSVCGEQPPQHQHLADLQIIDALLHESLRLATPVAIIGRDVAQPHVIGESINHPISMPVGATVQIPIHNIHRLKEYWGEHATTFDHTRWLQSKKPYSHPFAYLPFSQGSRNCVGQQFALLEAKVMLAMMVQRVRMEFVEGQKLDADGWPIRNNAITMRPKYPMLVRVYRREQKAAMDEVKR